MHLITLTSKYASEKLWFALLKTSYNQEAVIFKGGRKKDETCLKNMTPHVTCTLVYTHRKLVSYREKAMQKN